MGSWREAQWEKGEGDTACGESSGEGRSEESQDDDDIQEEEEKKEEEEEEGVCGSNGGDARRTLSPRDVDRL